MADARVRRIRRTVSRNLEQDMQIIASTCKNTATHLKHPAATVTDMERRGRELTQNQHKKTFPAEHVLRTDFDSKPFPALYFHRICLQRPTIGRNSC